MTALNSTQTFHVKRDPMRLSFSGIQDYQTCRQKWRLQYVYGLRSDVKKRPLEVGTAVHEGLAHFLAMNGTVEEGITIWRERSLVGVMDDDIVTEDLIDGFAQDALVLCYRALAEIRRRRLETVFLDDDRPAVELELSVPMVGWDSFEGHLDWVAYDPVKKVVWIVDFKNRGSFYGEDSEEVNLQNPIYQYLAAQHGIDVSGTMTFQISSTAPKTPKVNASDGKVSRAAIATDWATYRDAVVANGQDPADYDDMRLKLEGRDFVNIIEAYRSPAQVQRIWDSIVKPVAMEMAATRDLLMSEKHPDRRAGYWRVPRTLGQRTCNGCFVREVCLAGLKGYDVADAARSFTFRDPFTWALRDGAV